MNTIIAGSRSANWFNTVSAIYMSELDECITEVVCGGAKGADSHGATWAESQGIPVKTFNADWASFGKSAGPIRNSEMARYADALIAVWDGKSRGTKNIISQAEGLGLHVYIYKISSELLKR